VKELIRFAFAPAALCISLGALAQTPTTPITNVVVIFQENVSFDHYFGTYPNALNKTGETKFFPMPLTPTVNGYSPDLLKNNPNKNAAGTAQANPTRLTPAQAYTCSQNHSYGPEQQAVDSGLMDLFPKFVGRTTSQGCAPDGTTNLGYYDGNTVTAMWNYAQNFALNDNSFDSTFGPSTPGAINLISGQTFNGVLHFGTGSAGNAFPNQVGVTITDIGDFDAYLDDCGADKGGTVTTT
jgi:phospholipase C